MRSSPHRLDARSRPRATNLARLLFASLATTVVFALCAPAGAVTRRLSDSDPFAAASKVMNSSGTSPAFVQFAENNQPTVNLFVSAFLATIPLSADNALKVTNTETDEIGMTHYRLQQTYKGLPILGAEYVIHARNGAVVSANGNLASLPTLDATPALTEDAALALALARVGAQTYKWQDPFWVNDLKQRTGNPNASYYPKGLLCWSPPAFGTPGTPSRYALAWQFDIESASPTNAQRVIVDARTGDVVAVLPLQSNCVAATVVTAYNGSQGISTDKFTSTDYRLRDDCQSATIRIRDWNSTTTTANPVEIQNTTNTWTTQNERFGGSAQWVTKQAYEYYLNVFGRSSYDNSNGSVEGYINAVFGCGPGCTTVNNASMSFTGGTLLVGLGSAGVLGDCFAGLDILAHEYTHAVTGATAKLTYSNESGALNESFSDIFGETIENYVSGSNDWLLGEERASGPARSMSNPKTYNDPDTYLGTDWYTGTGDNGGVHTNSGVQNHWYYLLAAGGSGTNDNGWSFSVTGIGLTKAAAIAYRTLTHYLTSGSTYNDARTNSIAAAADLYGAGSPEWIAVIRAWRAVGIDPCQVNCPSNTQVNNAAGQCGAPVTFSVSDNGQCFSTTTTSSSGGFFPVGTTTVSNTSVSGASCSFGVTVVDAEKPTVSCPAPITVECTSHTGTPASDPAIQAFLNGFTASDNCTATPTKSNDAPSVFAHGSTTVTFTATDPSGNANSCTSTVKVVDTTPPVVSCPVDLTLECDSHCDASLGGVPATDAAVVAWLASFSATDECDPSPITSLPHPTCFKLGDTPVTFTATDHDGNASSCTRTVHVVDTTPPTIAVTLDRTVLWPPNHTMATINATVTVADVCDPNPYFQLMSIVSNEPDNGLGDGDTPNDIQGASYGTADTQFQLRSERSGTGSGRVYTITYRALDHSGNHADATATVRVPHDQWGDAVLAAGFDDNGTGFQPGAQTFAFVIRSEPSSAGSGTTSLAQPGASLPAGSEPDLAFNALAVDATQVLVGNGAGQILPIRTACVDADGDGYTDLVCFYSVAEAQALAAASTIADGPLGIHYNLSVLKLGSDYLVPNLFGVGAPSSMLNLGPTPLPGSTPGTGGAASHKARTGESGTGTSPGTGTDPAAGAASLGIPKPVPTPVPVTQLGDIYPVPSNKSVLVAFSLARDQAVDLSIYDIRGARVRSLVTGSLGAGRYQRQWDGRDEAGRTIAGGVYFVRMSAGRYSATRKIVMMP